MAKGRKKRAGRSLNLILWLAFSLFAIVIVALYAVAYSILMGRQYREYAVNSLLAAGEEMRAFVEETADEQTAVRGLYRIAYDYSASFLLIYEDGESVFPDVSEQQRYPALADGLRDQLVGGQARIFTTESELAYAAGVLFGGRDCYLYVTSSLAPLIETEEGLATLSLVCGLFAIVLAFVASGYIAMLITKPVTEVTERAKTLARGDYDLHFKEDYFCLEINELSDALDHARQEVSKADTIQKELIANVSHDFKTPLTMIKAYASMIREISGDNKEKRDAHAAIIISEADRLAALVGDVLDLSRLRAGVMTGLQSTFNLSDEIYCITGRFDFLRETQGYVIETEIEDGLYVSAGRERIEQVLYNLIGNAVNYTGEDKRIRVRLFRKGEVSRFEVIDSGKGIPPEEVDTVWDRYYRSSKTHKRPVKGTGLGLSIVKGILLAHGFAFGIISEVGKGSCFWVEFPPPEQAEIYEKKEEGR